MKFLFFFLLVISFASCQHETKPKDWLLIYYMPYDNDLEKFGAEIIELLRKGSTKNIAITIGADFKDQGIHQFAITNKKVRETIDKNRDDSGQGSCLEAYLNWAKQQFNFKKYAIIFLNHGGKLDELCQDDAPQLEFLNIQETAQVVQDFSESIRLKPALTFLQVCAKGSIESHLELAHCSDYTLCSQRILGAPNYYYEKMLFDLNRHPDYNGKELAWSIAKNEVSHMYDSYTCIDNRQLPKLLQSYKSYLNVISKDSIQFKNEKLLSYRYSDETYWDFKSFIKATTPLQETPEWQNSRDRLYAAINNTVAFNRKNKSSIVVKNYCGLFLFSPYDNDLNNYSHLNFFKEVSYQNFIAMTKKPSI